MSPAESVLNMNATFTNSTSFDFSGFTIFMISIHAISFFLGLPLNGYVIILLFPRRGVMDASDVYSWNQAISEILYVLFGSFNSLCCVSTDLCISEAVGFLLATSSSSRSLFQCCVCLEHYLAVVYPVTFLKYRPLRYRIACSIMTWIFSLPIGVISSNLYGNLPYNVLTILYIIVLTVNVFCCVSVLRKLRHPGPGFGEMNAAKKKAFQIVSVNLLAFIFQNVPISVAFGTQNILSDYVSYMTAAFSVAISTLIGVLQPVYVLHRADKLPLIQSTLFSTSCCSSVKS